MINFVQNIYSEKELRDFAKQKLFEDDWINISYYQNLSENFIREFQDKVNWSDISLFQNLSEKFIQEFENRINWIFLRKNEKIQVSDQFTIDFDKELRWFWNWKINNNYHRILGPAIICNYFPNKYWYRGNRINVKSDEEYFEWLKYKNF